MHPLKAIRGRLWRRLELRIQGVVSQRLDPVVQRLTATTNEALTVAREAHRLATEAAREIERLRPAVEASRAMDERLRDTSTKAKEANRLAMESSLAIERVLQAEIQLWQAIDAKPGG